MCLSDAVRQPEINRLRGLTEEGRAPFCDANGDPSYGVAMIVPHPKVKGLWFVAAGIDPSVITAELRRKIAKRPPIAQANATVQQVNSTDPERPGRYYEHTRQCFNYRTTFDCLLEHIQRTQMGQAQSA